MERLGDERAQCSERGLGLEARAHRAHLGDAPGERLGEEPDDDRQDVMDETHPALDPAHRPRELDRVAAQRIGCGGQARGLLGVGHHRLDVIELTRKPRGQTVRQQAEGGVAVATVPASDLCPARGLARVGAVARQRTSPVGVIRTAIEPCITPRPGTNVLLAGKPRLVAKLHRPWPGGGPPARANSSLVPRGAETTAATHTTPAMAMWTRPADRAPSYGPCGQGMDKYKALAHPLPTLGALTPKSSPLLQQRFMRTATAPASTASRIASSSQAIRLRNKPANCRGDSTRQSEKQQRRRNRGLVNPPAVARALDAGAHQPHVGLRRSLLSGGGVRDL